ncbi:SIMPL domain-containing protein [Citreimonas sp.]|uniref:SIMPL domain-containing protein n=1 Tax=Citreimonas sp. TaxID=3036715 RepID=UPI004058ECED
MRAILTAILLAMASPVLAQATLTVTGDGSRTVAPDMAVVTLGVTERAARASEAMNAASTTAEAIIQRLGAAGVAPADMQTTDLSLYPVRENDLNGQAQFEGFEASNQLTVQVRDLESLGPVLQAVLDDGANRLSSLRFTLQDPRPIMNEARRAAVEDARAKAKLYADAAGVTLGAIQSISEPQETNGGPQPMMAMEASRGVPVEAGSTTINARVTMVWELVQP